MTWRSNLRAPVVISIVLMAFISPAAAKVIYVDDDGPSDFNTIQAAIEAAVDGDTIIVAEGRYTGDGNQDIDFNGKGITVRSTDPNDPNVVAETIIDCNGTDADPHRGFYFHRSEDGNSIVDGLTITNGYASGNWSPEPHGGGILCFGSSPTVSNCLISGNVAEYNGGGGGIHCWNSRSVITKCNITRNRGGICFNRNSTIMITNCRINDNADSSGISCYNSGGKIVNCTITGNGLGIYCSTASPNIAHCSITDNGCGISCSNGAPKISYCTISGNKARTSAGIACEQNSNATIEYCTITDNTAEWGGGGITCYYSSPTISYCTISGNSALGIPGAGGVGAGIWCSSKSSPCIINTDISGT